MLMKFQMEQQYENDKFQEKKKEKNALFHRLKLVGDLLNEISGHILDIGKEMKDYSKRKNQTR
jgi:hypothetical protein